MEKKVLYEHIVQLEDQMSHLVKEMGMIKQTIVTLLEENHHLTLENQHLRKRLEDTITVEASDKIKP